VHEVVGDRAGDRVGVGDHEPAELDVDELAAPEVSGSEVDALGG
jgi:hypothetical protein